MRSFGIGCYHFGIKKAPPFKITINEYINEIKNSLNKIQNLNNLQIECFEEEDYNIEDAIETIDKERGVFPNPLGFLIKFELFIPLRIQSELGVVELPTEKFTVTIVYNYFLPVVIIEPHNYEAEIMASSAVRLIRLFLGKEFKSDVLRFESLGPSPFHVDCFIKPEDSFGDLTIWSKRFPQRGYDKIYFYYNPKSFSNENEVLEKIIDETDSELGFFYSIIQHEASQFYKWSKIELLVKNLTRTLHLGGIKGFINKFLLCSRESNNIFISSAEFQSNEIMEKKFLRKHYKDVYFGEQEGHFKHFIDSEIENRIEYPIKQVNELISFLENRRLHILEISMLLFAAIIGGVVGALLTYLLT